MASNPGIYNLLGQGVTPLLSPFDVQAKKLQMANALAAQQLEQQQIQSGALTLQQQQRAVDSQQATQRYIMGLPPAGGSINALAPSGPAPGPAPASLPAAGLPVNPDGSALPSAPAYDPTTASSAAPAPAAAPAVPQRPAVPTMRDLISAGVLPSDASALIQQFQKIDENASTIDKNRADAAKANADLGASVQKQAADVANAMVQARMNPAVVSGLIDHFASLGPQQAQMAAQFRAKLASLAPADQLAYATSIASQNPELTTANATAATSAQTVFDKKRADLISQLGAVNPNAPDAQEQWTAALVNAGPDVAKGLPGTFSPANQASIVKSGTTATEQVTAAETARQHNLEHADRVATQSIEQAKVQLQRMQLENIQLTPQALDQMATMFATTGVLPNLGMGQAVAATRSSIINRAAQLFPNVSFASNAAAYQANKKSLNNVTGALDTLTSFENAGLKNLKMFTDAAAKIPDTGVPWLNVPVRMLDEKLVGSQNMAVVNAARDVALREIARVTNDPKLSGVLSDSARAEVQSLSPKNATLPQILAVAKVLQTDMANVHQSLQEQKDAISSRLGASPAGAPARAVNPGSAGVTVTDPNGGVHTFPDQASADKFKTLAGIR